MPIGPYKDWDECIRANSDKDDPEAYCGALERQATQGSNMTHVALVAPEGVLTSDSRFFQHEAWSWPRERVALQFTDKTTEGHLGAENVGNVQNFRRAVIDGVTWIVGDVEYDDGKELAMEARRLADEDVVAGLSADYIGSATIEVTETDEMGEPTAGEIHYDEAELVGVTQLPIPAFGGARIVTAEAFAQMLDARPLVAALNPKATVAWFADPELAGPTPLTVTDDGRVFGHLATWGTCHVGFEGACVTPPESQTDYAYFNLGCVSIDGEEIPCGHITLGTGHATLAADRRAAADHYDNTGTVVADVRAGDDNFGIWVAGALRPGADADTVRAASLSGDWRNVDGHLELVAALAVNVPGFPVPRIQARVASGEQLALVASGVVEQRSRDDLIYEALRLLTDEVRALRGDSQTGEYVASVPEMVDSTEPTVVVNGKLAAILDATG